MNSGNRPVSITSIFGVGLLLAAAAAHGPGAPREPGILVAAELIARTPAATLLDCAAEAFREPIELRFERITTDPDPDEMRRLLSRGAQRTISFEWDAESGELSYGASAPFTPPAIRGAVAWRRAPASCVSR